MVPGCDNPGGNFDFRIVSTAGGNNGTSTQIGELGSATAAMTADGHLYDLVRTTFANQPANGEDWVRDLRDPLYYADLRSTINPSAPTTALDTIYNMLNSEMISAGSRAEGVAP